MGYTRTEWSEHFSQGRGFRPLGDKEKGLLAELVPAPEGVRALDACCGTGGLVTFLASLGCTVDGADFSEGALARARSEHAEVERVRWLCLDVDDGDLAALAEDVYGLITVRLAVAFFRNRTYTLRRLAARLRVGGALVVITPVVKNTPEERRNIALDEDELALLGEGFETAERFDADGLAVVVLRGPGVPFTAKERNRPAPGAVFGAAAVITDEAGRVLLGRNSVRGMWELPAGGVEPGESAVQAAVRELAEETGLVAREDDAHLLTILHDEREDVVRLSAVVRITAFSGTPGRPEPDRFLRWEFHALHTLATLGKIFAPSAHSLNAVWPGVLPGLPPVRSYPIVSDVPPVPGEPAEAARLRARMTDTVIAGGWAPSARVQAALRTVPRHRFAPEFPLETAYDDDLAVVTARDATGAAVSSVSAAWLQADMIEQVQLAPGETVLEVGSGGYNAELIAHVVGPNGRVISVDIGPSVVRRAERLCAEAGSGRVAVVLGDGSLGAPAQAPAAGFDGILITHTTADIAPAWRQQLADGRRMVVPLEIGGYTRSITLERCGEVLRAVHWTYCGFVRDRGAAARIAPTVPLAGGAVTVRWEDGVPGDTHGLEEALRGPRHELATGVAVPGEYSFETLQLYAATTQQGFCRLAVPEGSTLITQKDAAAIVADGSLAYLTHVKIRDAPKPADRRWEFTIHGHGPFGPDLAERLAGCVRDWDRHVRDNGYPPMTVHVAGTPDDQLPPGDVLDKPSSRLVLPWPGRTPVQTQDLLAAGDPRA
ncbi:methyltransferase, FxLD system [Streptomyces sp. NPDC101062]|uniref:methyltransferase, FxLD system n=1 Tax=unclassified Streptomyces TaxID=2593676 RepID=UPI00382BA945